MTVLPAMWIVTIRRYNEQEPFECVVETLIGTPAIFLSRERAESVAKGFKQRGLRFEVAEIAIRTPLSPAGALAEGPSRP